MSATFCITCLLMEHIAAGFSAVWSWCTLLSGQINTLEIGEHGDRWKEDDVQDDCEKNPHQESFSASTVCVNWSVCQWGWSQVPWAFCWSGGGEGAVSRSIMSVTCVCNTKGALNESDKAESNNRALCTGGVKEVVCAEQHSFPCYSVGTLTSLNVLY